MKRFTLADLPANAQAEALRQLHPHYVTGFVAYQPRDTGTPTVMESDLRPRALGKGKAKEGHSGRVLVRVTAFRVRLLDEDNLCEKYHVDCCRYAGLLSGDDPSQAKIQTSQVKVKRKQDERVLIEITPLP